MSADAGDEACGGGVDDDLFDVPVSGEGTECVIVFLVGERQTGLTRIIVAFGNPETASPAKT